MVQTMTAPQTMQELLSKLSCVDSAEEIWSNVTAALQDDDGDLWLDLGCNNWLSESPSQPPIPKIVSIDEEDDIDDDISDIGDDRHAASRKKRRPKRQISQGSCGSDSTLSDILGSRFQDPYPIEKERSVIIYYTPRSSEP